MSSGKVKKTGKEILTAVKEKENYKECLFESKPMRHRQTKIIQKEHEIYTATQMKTSLSPFNDNKWIFRQENDFTTYSFGHYKTEKEELVDSLSVIF